MTGRIHFRERLALCAYLVAVNVLMPIGIVLGLPILLLKAKRRKTLLPRLGVQQFPTARDSKAPLWIHALSLGETLSCISLVEALRSRMTNRPIYFSVSTLSAREIAVDRIQPFVDGIFYFPLDLWWPARRALRSVSPGLMVFIETDIWPGFQYQLRRSGTPAVLVNGRLSPASYRACSRFRSLFAPALNTFRTVHPQSAAEAKRYAEVGLSPEKLGFAGNLKFDVACRTGEPDEPERMRAQLGLTREDTVVLSGSTHPGEEEAVLAAFAKVRERFPDARLIMVPRHPARAHEAGALAGSAGLRVEYYSTVGAIRSWDVLVVDAMGILSKLYALAGAAFVGGSLVPKGGQNPLESAAAGCPVLFGPDMSDFPDISRWLLDNGAALQVTGGVMLGERWLEVLCNTETRQRMTEACLRVVDEHRGATEIIADEISRAVSSWEWPQAADVRAR